ncbi:hypothetical protein BDV96DRAFT_579973 [Lophiotrema nucula]|uniref:DNA-directed DNA polymerase n=1 Tax=Lophiotrema nucula TaxID=690887 RepID=A0A6A5Z2N5_9PLEO|nr:hypothetical protein BDV96DRAFT_579973 [Lophiotrema nucula]
MDDELPSSPQTVRPDSPVNTRSRSLDLRSIPPVLILPAHFQDNEEHALEETLRRCRAPVTSDSLKAKLFIGKVGTKRRAEFELRSRKFQVEEVIGVKRVASPFKGQDFPSKKRKLDGSWGKPIVVQSQESTTEDEVPEGSETEDELPAVIDDTPPTSPVRPEDEVLPEETPVIFNVSTHVDLVWVVKVDWLDGCLAAGRLLPLGDHLVYKGKILERPAPLRPKHKTLKSVFAGRKAPASHTAKAVRPETAKDILERAKADASGTAPKSTYVPHRIGPSHGSRRFEGKAFASAQQPSNFASQTAHLLQQTTSEYDGEDSDIPAPPPWVQKRIKYSCQRFTPFKSPNDEFIELLKKIRTARILIDDEIGVRAYSTIIASLAAYPYKLVHPRQIVQIPGCEDRAAQLWVEWANTGKIKAVEDFENDEAMKVLNLFYNIWGVGAKTARQFYYNNHWTEMDDIIEFGWNDLDRVQQIGVKYYDEFLDGIPRKEVEQIAAVVRQHALHLRDNRITVTIVGGYRRGKDKSGDVDMIVSHPDLESTAGLVKDIVESLEEAEWITHTLTMSLNSTHRGQSTLPFRTTKASGAGFDTLDKALVVWQDPNWPTKAQDRATNPNARSPNIHRRVDIIIAPWRTVGCAVMGWSGGTTFQRDLRRYAKYAKGWKFDSSGIRNRSTGEVVPLEGPEGVHGTPEDAEKAVFQGLGLEYVPPEMRCTG